ncbi:MAG: tRNA uridine-5-carboxymethylaminomethyl(34) synthesis enzyme MnmG, partial [Bacteroidetes bacterium]|nr:tRNA uridine-5-carboxymethylaminomethyl(34) synthesis enzyme MnmG [Bacteroidota bacterium]
NKISIKPDQINQFLLKNFSAPIKQKTKLKNLISRPQFDFKDFLFNFPGYREKIDQIPESIFNEVVQAVEINIKYAGYIDRESTIAEKLRRLENIVIENKFDYGSIMSLSTEAREKLIKINPKTIGQAHRIPGISPNDINVLLILLGR